MMLINDLKEKKKRIMNHNYQNNIILNYKILKT